jgi:hypothetical protein
VVVDREEAGSCGAAARRGGGSYVVFVVVVARSTYGDGCVRGGGGVGDWGRGAFGERWEGIWEGEVAGEEKEGYHEGRKGRGYEESRGRKEEEEGSGKNEEGGVRLRRLIPLFIRTYRNIRRDGWLFVCAVKVVVDGGERQTTRHPQGAE